MITLKDIAKEAGVSIMTVSRVVNGHHSKVSEANVQKIQEIIKKRGYVPNSTARSLSSKNSRIISVIVRGNGRQLTNPYNAAMVGEIANHIQEHDYFIMMHFIDKYDDITQQLRAWNSQGSIFIGTFDEDIQKIQQDNRIPLIFTDSYSHVRQITNVGIDDYKGGSLAAIHFIENGHKSFAFIGSSLKSSVVQHRLNGFRETLKLYGFTLKPENILEASVPFEYLAKAVCNFKERVTAIFIPADLIAISFINELRKLGYNVPDDYSVIGFDNLPLCGTITPRLTTISQDIGKKALFATDLLFKHFNDPDAPAENIVLDVQLREHDSVKNLNK